MDTKKKKIRTQEQIENRNGYIYIMPWLIGFFAFTLLPMMFSLVISFSKWDIVSGMSGIEMIGGANYSKMWGDRKFWKALEVTFKYCLMAIPINQIMALVFALLLNMRVPFMRFFRSVYFLPSIIPGIATSMIMMQILGEKGLLNQGLAMIGLKGPAWLNTPQTSLFGLVIVGLWGFGNTMIIYLSGLQSVSEDLYEASQIDGAGAFTRFFRITVPMISPTIFFNMVMSIIGSFQYFDQAYVMTEGGPLNSTLFYNLYLYTKAYREYEVGFAAAMAWVMFIIILVLTMVVIKSSSFWVFYQNDDKI
jgi:ABC-type sugar transport systems, permease components